MTASASTQLGRPSWYELMTTDLRAAESFYTEVVGWTTTAFDGVGYPYTMFNRPGGVPVAGVMARLPEVSAAPFWAMYVAVPRLEEAALRITGLGGSEATPVFEVPGIGRMQLMKDPQGAVFYIYEPATADEQPEAPAEVGDGSWHELVTTDAAAAMTFYQEVFGWTPSDVLDMGPAGQYRMFNRPHGMIGGMMDTPPQMAHVPPHWEIYFRVPDIHAAVERVTANGGRILNGPTEVPGGDLIVNAMDPQGVAFSLHMRKAQ